METHRRDWRTLPTDNPDTYRCEITETIRRLELEQRRRSSQGTHESRQNEDEGTGAGQTSETHENGTEPNGTHENGTESNGTHEIKRDLFLDIVDVTMAIEKIPNGASPGPDGVPVCLLKNSKINIARMLVQIYKSSLETGDIPEVLKLAFVSPIHKGGSRADPAQYRPISLTSHVCKVLERIIRKALVNFLEFNNKMDSDQHGSRAKRSCLTQLLEHHDEILKILEDGDNADLIYLDFAKAFDKCDIGILLHKLKGTGISGKLGRWLHAFLSDRKQTVIVNGKKSKMSQVKSGVPQGTVLGPLMFLIYISDIGNNIKSSKKIYVDDTKLKARIQTENDVEILQDDIDHLQSWAEMNNMKFNGSKFQLLRYGPNESVKEDTFYFTGDGEEIIDRFENLKDLGVIMNQEATFNDHVTHIEKKVRQKIGWITRSFYTRKTQFMKQIYKSLVIPHLDYCSQL